MITSEDFSDPIRTLWTRSCGFVQPDLDNGQASIALSFWHQLQTDFPLTLTLVRPFWFHYFAPPLRNLNCANVVSMIGTSEAQPRVSHGRHVACRIASMPDDKGMEWEVDDHLPWHLSPCISQFCAWCWVRSWCWGDQRSTCCTIDVCLVRCCGERWTLLIAERGRIYLQIWHDFLEELQPAWNTISTQWIATLEISSKVTCVSAPVRRHAAVKAKLQTPSLLSWWRPYRSFETFSM